MRYCAFLRAINVGKANRIRMDALRELCGGLGFEGVSTYLQTGNIHFEWGRSEEEARDVLEAALVERGMKNAFAMVWPREELEAFAATDPFADHPAEAKRQYVTLYREPLPAGILEALAADDHTVAAEPRIHCSAYPPETRTVDVMSSPLTKRIKVPGTTRYWHVFRDFLEQT